MVMEDAASQLKLMNHRFAELSKASPSPLAAFRNLMIEASKGGVLPAKFKELLAVAIAVNQGCVDCILFHVSIAKSHGVTRLEFVEALVVCIEMGGGPGSVYAGKALAAFDALST